MTSSDPKKIEHLYAILFRKSKIIKSNYERYLNEKITSKELAQKMVAKINENPTINHFRALEPAAFTEIKFTSDGLRELPREAFSVKAGFRIYPQNSKSIQVSNDGFITIVYNDKKQVFSPYPFEVTNKIL